MLIAELTSPSQIFATVGEIELESYSDSICFCSLKGKLGSFCGGKWLG